MPRPLVHKRSPSAPARRPARPAARGKAKVKDAKAQAHTVMERLSRAMPLPVIELDFEGPWQLLVATILSAQSTDKMVNRVTPELFRRYPTPRALGAAPQEQVEVLVKSTGFFRNKAKAIREASKQIAERFGGEVPRTMDALITLPGVARKTANVVLGGAYQVASGIVVDTHAGRVARRLGLTAADDPEEVEAALCALLPTDAWILFGQRLVLHGRYVCLARRPQCTQCPLNETCPSREAPAEGPWEARAGWERRLTESRGERAAAG